VGGERRLVFRVGRIERLEQRLVVVGERQRRVERWLVGQRLVHERLRQRRQQRELQRQLVLERQ
jgi:hypothetical protein